MPNCYICGTYIAPNTGCRRKVQTGNSVGVSFGRRVTPSTRTYYGLRTLCVSCATKHDEAEKTKGILALIIIAIFIFFILFYSCGHAIPLPY